MAKFSIEFHAIPAEIIEYVGVLVAESKLFLTATYFPPISHVAIQADEIPSILGSPRLSEIVFTRGQPNAAVPGLAFAAANLDALHLSVGRIESDGLHISGLHGQNAKLWNFAISKLKAITNSGAIVENVASGAKVQLRNHRFTGGARELVERGVPALGLAGKNGPRYSFPSGPIR